MKKILFSLFLVFSSVCIFAQTDDELFGGYDDDEMFFVSDDDLFGEDDDFFFDDGIDVITDVAATSDLSKGMLFEDGSIKIGGIFTTSLGTSTVIYADDDKNFGDHLKDTTLTPTLSSFLTLDARPNQDLRMYTKFGLAYPYETTAASIASTSGNEIFGKTYYSTMVSTKVSDYLKVKEMFTDFSVADRAFFRFGLHTVTWGTGFFFSPVSDLINTSSIDPEDTSAQVDGSLNLRTQITFPDSQNCLWFYVIPSTEFTNQTAESYLKDTAFAAKTDLVFGGWEFGLGGFYKNQNSPKAMITASGSLKKINLFGEAVYQYGGDSEWAKNKDWSDKTSIFKATAGFSYTWKTPVITLAGQYYYDGNNVDKIDLVPLVSNATGMDESIVGVLVSGSIPTFTQGHNFALLANFGKVFGTKDVTATVFAMANVGRDKVDCELKDFLISSMGMTEQANAIINGIKSAFNTITASAKLNYSPTNSIMISAGPSLLIKDFDSDPTVLFNLNFTLGGGKF